MADLDKVVIARSTTPDQRSHEPRLNVRKNLYVILGRDFFEMQLHGLGVATAQGKGRAEAAREMKKALRETLFKYKLHQDQELLNLAYGYIRQYY